VNTVKPNETAQVRQQEVIYPENVGYYGEAGFPYPGIENPYAGGGRNLPVAYSSQSSPSLFGGGAAGGAGTAGGAAGGGGGGGGLLGNFNLGQVKGFVDKMGGIDGIVGTMTRVQKMVSSFQQMAPMLKLLMGSFGGAKAAANSLKDGGGYSRKRTRRKGKKPIKKHRTTSGKSKVYKGRKKRRY
jgi:hypothetical protein